MTKNEANKIIAEYMFTLKDGFVNELNKQHLIERSVSDGRYTKSLDELVLVWDKMIGCGVKFTLETLYTDDCQSDEYNMYFADMPPLAECNSCGAVESNYPQHSSGSIYEAAAHATAKAILALKK